MPTTLLCRPVVFAPLSQRLYHSLRNLGASGAQFANAISQAFFGGDGIKIYFAGSIRGGREDAAFYHQIIALLIEYGEVLTEHIGDIGNSSQQTPSPSSWTWGKGKAGDEGASPIVRC
jgi:hypothetical protein